MPYSMRCIVTGGAGFIGSVQARLLLKKTEATVLVVDKFTYAGVLESLKEIGLNPMDLTSSNLRLSFLRTDTNVVGTVTLLQVVLKWWKLHPDRPGHDLRYAIEPDKLMNNLGWKPYENFKTGIHKTVQWYLDNEWWWGPIHSDRYSGQRLGMGR